MSGISNTHANFTYSGPLATRMACTLGDMSDASARTVLCNILGDQPLFYVDYIDSEEVDFLDPLALFDTDMNGLPPEIRGMQERMMRLEKAARHVDEASRRAKIPTELDFFRACYNAAHIDSDQQALLHKDGVEALIEQSRFLTLMWQDCKLQGAKLRLSDQVEYVTYDREARSLLINPYQNQVQLALTLPRALRQAWMHIQGALIHPLHFSPEEAVLLHRIQTADGVCAGIRAAWELHLGGRKEAWDRLITGSAYDVAVGFARESVADFRALQSGDATRIAFERWFFSGRCKETDRKLIQHMLADQHGLVFEQQAMSRIVTADVIARTGDMPGGKNYLSDLIETIMTDPLFSEVRDRSNANFLWFIKFERSFRQSEQNLQDPQNTQSPAPLGAGTQNGQQQAVSTHGTSSTIIRFKRPNRRKKAADKDAQDSAATIYYLDHFTGLS